MGLKFETLGQNGKVFLLQAVRKQKNAENTSKPSQMKISDIGQQDTKPISESQNGVLLTDTHTHTQKKSRLKHM